jgi:exoribonuclease R
MKTLGDPDRLLVAGLAKLRQRFAVPNRFPTEVLAEADRMAACTPDDHADWTDRAFVTLDPATSTDLDQAFLIEPVGKDLLLHYALADIGWFVREGGALESEAWNRGVTLYLPDGRARLYPPVLSEGAASLLPDGPRPAVVVSVCCDPAGSVQLTGVHRAIVRSRAKLAYETVDMAQVPHLEDFAARMRRAEDLRGAARVDPPDQELERDADGRFRLSLRPWLPSEVANSALSLAANIAIAEALYEAKTGLFREMPAPDARAVERLRGAARGFGLAWPAAMTLAEFERTVDPRTVAGAGFQFAVRRATGFATYTPYSEGHRPFHAALGATYTHATAPMRRLADRYILDTLLALANGEPTRDAAYFAGLAEVMAAADVREGAIERAVMDLAEAALLAGREGEVFSAVVTERDERGARIQLRDLPVIARVDTKGVGSGEEIEVRLLTADGETGTLRFERVR